MNKILPGKLLAKLGSHFVLFIKTLDESDKHLQDIQTERENCFQGTQDGDTLRA